MYSFVDGNFAGYDDKYAWICPNPKCFHYNHFENNEIIRRSYCKGCMCFINIDKTIQELTETYEISAMCDDYLCNQMDDVLNTKYSLDTTVRWFITGCFDEYKTDIFREINGEIVLINQEISDAIKKEKEEIMESSRIQKQQNQIKNKMRDT